MNASLPTLHPEPVPTARPVHRPIRALHVLAGLNRGGVENWIVEVVRRVDPQRLNLDLLVQTEKAGDHEAAVEAMGVRILRCPGPEHLLGYGRRFPGIPILGEIPASFGNQLHRVCVGRPGRRRKAR